MSLRRDKPSSLGEDRSYGGREKYHNTYATTQQKTQLVRSNTPTSEMMFRHTRHIVNSIKKKSNRDYRRFCGRTFCMSVRRAKTLSLKRTVP